MPDLSLFDLTGKKALVTGGAVGIGRGCALALARAGADVAILDIDELTGPITADELKGLGHRAMFVQCDVTVKDQVQEAVRLVTDWNVARIAAWPALICSRLCPRSSA